MNMSFVLLSDSVGTSAGTTGGLVFSYIISIILVLSAFYLICCVPQMKKQKKRQEMLKSMEIGDVVVTTGDFYGVLVDITDEDVIVKFGGGDSSCCIPMKKSAIAEVEKAEKNL